MNNIFEATGELMNVMVKVEDELAMPYQPVVLSQLSYLRGTEKFTHAAVSVREWEDDAHGCHLQLSVVGFNP